MSLVSLFSPAFILLDKELNLGDSPVIGIDANANVLDALSLMSK